MLIGLVGKPSAGKSTLFRALTLADAEIANYPFTTIEPNKGVGFVRVECIDKEFHTQCNPRTGFCVNHIRYVPVDIIDVAGLVPGAHEGKGLGNKFLDDLRNADVLIHVVDVSGSVNEKGEPVGVGNYDPIKDIDFLEYELDMWFYQVLNKSWDKVAKTQASQKKKLIDSLVEIVSGLSVKAHQLEKAIRGYPEFMNTWSLEQVKEFSKALRRESKPIVIAANKIDIPIAEENFKRLKDKYPDLVIIRVSSESELALKEASKKGIIEYWQGSNDFVITKLEQLNDKQKSALNFIKTNILKKYNTTGVQDILEKAVFDTLKYIAIFPAGVNKLADSEGRVLPDCFLMPPKTTALDFAYKLHSDFGDKFIKGILVKTKQMIGKEYELKHRDALEIVSGR